MNKIKTIAYLSIILGLSVLTGCEKGSGSDKNPELASVNTISVGSISTMTASATIELLSAGYPSYTELGVCVSTDADPTVDDIRFVTSGGGKGVYICGLTNLASDTQYYMRAYAVNTAGVAYGENLIFKTKAMSNKVNVTAGGLEDAIINRGMTNATELFIEGSLDKRDFEFIRDVMKKLEVLDIGHVTIAEYEDYPANEFPRYAFSQGNSFDASPIKYVNIPTGVTSIGEGAFYNCKNMAGSLIIPANVTRIGRYAFYECNGLTGSLALPQNLDIIGQEAFYNCSRLTSSLRLPARVKEIRKMAFAGCGFTGELVLPGNLVTIEQGAFRGCKFTGDLIIPDSVEEIESFAFADTNFNGTLAIGTGLSAINANAFYSCGFRGTVIIPENIAEIGSSAFANCKHIAEVVIPTNVETIQVMAFKDCTSLLKARVSWERPIEYNYDIFPSTTSIYVPKAYLDNYLNAGGWKYHYIIGY